MAANKMLTMITATRHY